MYFKALEEVGRDGIFFKITRLKSSILKKVKKVLKKDSESAQPIALLNYS